MSTRAFRKLGTFRNIMEYMDKDLTCLQCGGRFTFGVSEQEFLSRRGLKNEPKRCPSCRVVRSEWLRWSKVDATIQGSDTKRQVYGKASKHEDNRQIASR